MLNSSLIFHEFRMTTTAFLAAFLISIARICLVKTIKLPVVVTFCAIVLLVLEVIY